MQYADAFRAMDTDIDVVIETDGRPDEGFRAVRDLFALQEARFSRFLEESEVSRLNRGETVRSRALAELLRMSIEAHRVTGGLFNPLVLEALEQAGYDRTFGEVSGGVRAPQLVPQPGGVVFVEGVECRLEGAKFDGGGIVKGLTVDLAVDLLGRLGYGTVLVNAGGDLRAAGQGDGPEGWHLAVATPGAGEEMAWQGLLEGALATSTPLRRRWMADDGNVAHHLIDPRTGLPADSPYVQVSCIAEEARVAETWSKAVLIGGVEGFREAVVAGVQVLAIAENGATSRAGFA